MTTAHESPFVATRATPAVRRLGFWSAVVAAASSVVWFLTFQLKDALAPMPDWHDAAAYAEAFDVARIAYVYPSLVLAVAFLALLVAVHHSLPDAARVWSLLSLVVGVVYATMASINYNIQAAAVKQSLAAGELAGIEMFLPDNPLSVFNAMANSYVYMALAMVFLAPAFVGRGIESWIRRILLAQAVTAVGQIWWSFFGLPMGVFIATSLVWVIGAPAAFVLMAVLFGRARHA